jgi:hypothetical protein
MNCAIETPMCIPFKDIFCDLLKTSRGGCHKAEVWSTRLKNTTQILGMELHAYEPGVVLEFNDLHSHALVVFPTEMQPSFRQPDDVVRVDFVSVPMAFINDFLLATELS